MPLSYKAALQKDRTNAKALVQFQHRHFAIIASLIRDSGERTEDKRRIANILAQGLEKTNPNFDRARFFSAVGVDDPYVTEAA